MASSAKCRHCGSDELQEGTLNSTGRVGFRPSHSRFMVLRTADIEVKAELCMRCGTVQLTGDFEKMKALAEQTKSSS